MADHGMEHEFVEKSLMEKIHGDSSSDSDDKNDKPSTVENVKSKILASNLFAKYPRWKRSLGDVVAVYVSDDDDGSGGSMSEDKNIGGDLGSIIIPNNSPLSLSAGVR
ncbi:hypothetical protein LWI29_000854 [Acer saccharum]|uniref:Uncharacterized protein n=1 Tax=Acer saccharum TaxID=4024 RepID=A0AA39RAB3_ACESA|nr:hypothetical protein LWI29_000854 [Acer saccharum]